MFGHAEKNLIEQLRSDNDREIKIFIEECHRLQELLDYYFAAYLDSPPGEELAMFIAYGLRLSSIKNYVVRGSLIKSYVDFISRNDEGPINEQRKDRAISNLSKAIDSIWRNPENRAKIFPIWARTPNAQTPGRPTITYGVYNWVIDIGNQHKMKLTEYAARVPLQIH